MAACRPIPQPGLPHTEGAHLLGQRTVLDAQPLHFLLQLVVLHARLRQLGALTLAEPLLRLHRRRIDTATPINNGRQQTGVHC